MVQTSVREQQFARVHIGHAATFCCNYDMGSIQRNFVTLYLCLLIYSPSLSRPNGMHPVPSYWPYCFPCPSAGSPWVNCWWPSHIPCGYNQGNIIYYY